jgi:hypothetical protein
MSGDELWVGVQWPARHAFYSPYKGRTDSYLLLETIRQLTILGCHAHYGTPLDAHFVMSALGCEMSEGVTPRAQNIAVRLTGTSVRRSTSGDLQSVRMKAEFYSSGSVFATGYGDAMIVSDRVYSRLRHGRIALRHGGQSRPSGSTVEPASVGHLVESDVVLGRDYRDGSFPLSLDLSNPFLFDHPLDHIAGMIPVEAVRQILRVSTGDPEAEISSADFVYDSALEFDAPVHMETHSRRGRSSINFVQDGRIAVRAQVTTAQSPDAGHSSGSNSPKARLIARDATSGPPRGERMSTSPGFAATGQLVR